MVNRKLNDDEVRCLRKIFVTWLKKEGYYEDYINAKMLLHMHPYTNKDGWPHNLNESEIFNSYSSYSNIIDRTIDYSRCVRIRNDWYNINEEWENFIYKHYELIVGRFFSEKKKIRRKIDKLKKWCFSTLRMP